MKTTALLIILILLGCGADPDDYMMEESDGCKSGDKSCEKKEPTPPVLFDDDDDDEEKKPDTPKIGDQEKDDTGVNDVIVPDGFYDENKNFRNQDWVDENCEVNKLCRGASKQFVLEILERPTTIKMKKDLEIWSWSEYGERHICGYFDCELTFKNGLLFEQKKLDSVWLDLSNF